jgi:hypothetical protein
MTKTIDQKLADLEARRARLIERKRKQDTRQKIIVGALILAEAEQSPAAARKLIDLIAAKVSREVDQQAMAPLVEALHKVASHG